MSENFLGDLERGANQAFAKGGESSLQVSAVVILGMIRALKVLRGMCVSFAKDAVEQPCEDDCETCTTSDTCQRKSWRDVFAEKQYAVTRELDGENDSE